MSATPQNLPFLELLAAGAFQLALSYLGEHWSLGTLHIASSTDQSYRLRSRCMLACGLPSSHSSPSRADP